MQTITSIGYFGRNKERYVKMMNNSDCEGVKQQKLGQKQWCEAPSRGSK